jgi:hypothetical protein
MSACCGRLSRSRPTETRRGAGQAALRMSDALGPQVDYPSGYGATG